MAGKPEPLCLPASEARLLLLLSLTLSLQPSLPLPSPPSFSLLLSISLLVILPSSSPCPLPPPPAPPLVQESEDAVKVLAKEKDLLEREKWDLRRQNKESSEHTGALRSQLDLKENRIKELEAELAMVRTNNILETHAIKNVLYYKH